MKIESEKRVLVDALSTAARALSSRGALQALSGILIDAGTDGVTVSASDGDISLRVPLEANVVTPGRVLAPGRLLSDVGKALADGKVTLEHRVSEGDLEISAGASTFHLKVFADEDFPPIPEPEGDPIPFPAPALVETIARVAGASSTDEARPVLTGVFVSASGSELTMVATDSYRLAVKKTELPESIPSDVEANLPARALRELSRLIEASDTESIDLWLGENRASFSIAGAHLSTRLIEGQFPRYQQLIPESFDHEVTCDREELLDVVRRVAQLAQRNAALRMSFSTGELTLSAQTQDLGDATEALPVSFDGEALEIGFNPEFIRSGLEAISSEQVKLRLISPLRPGLLEPADESDFSYLVMPIRLND